VKIHFAACIILLLLLGIPACSEDGIGPGRGGDGVPIEGNRAVSKMVGPLDSTSIAATGSNGASYTLTVPRFTAHDTGR
jgi:hypothetical protein